MKAELFSAGRTPTDDLTLFFTGWSMDAQPFRSCLPTDRDCLICSDYRSLDFDGAPLRRYARIRVVAWSMGVWAAAMVLPATGLRFRHRLAVNGTMFPVDDDLGIPKALFAGTLAGLTPASLGKFHRRMCADRESFLRFADARPGRPFDEVRDELAAIGHLAAAGRPAGMTWDQAIIGDRDRIFPVENQLRAWRGIGIVRVDAGHWLPSWRGILAGDEMACL